MNAGADQPAATNAPTAAIRGPPMAPAATLTEDDWNADHHDFLVVRRPTLDSLDPAHPLRHQGENLPGSEPGTSWPISRVEDDYLPNRPFLHPSNSHLWNIILVNPPFADSPSCKPKPLHETTPENQRKKSTYQWPPAAIGVPGLKCNREHAVFHQSTFELDGSILLRPCYNHVRNGKQSNCEHRAKKVKPKHLLPQGYSLASASSSSTSRAPLAATPSVAASVAGPSNYDAGPTNAPSASSSFLSLLNDASATVERRSEATNTTRLVAALGTIATCNSAIVQLLKELAYKDAMNESFREILTQNPNLLPPDKMDEITQNAESKQGSIGHTEAVKYMEDLGLDVRGMTPPA